MISVFIGILTFILVVDSLFLILLVLIQLPKKDAGAGMAFGAGATEALFGAGSGNALTKITKYVATAFFILALTLSVLHTRRANMTGGTLAEREFKKKAASQKIVPAPANQLQNAGALTNIGGLSRGILSGTNAVAPVAQPSPAPNAPGKP